jgi:hypothetical protein
VCIVLTNRPKFRPQNKSRGRINLCATEFFLSDLAKKIDFFPYKKPTDVCIKIVFLQLIILLLLLTAILTVGIFVKDNSL